MDKLKLIKFIVAVLTFLIIFGMLSAVGIIYKKIRPQPLPQTSINLQQPAGSTIADFKVIENNIYILTKNGGKSDRLIIINPQQPQNNLTISVN